VEALRPVRLELGKAWLDGAVPYLVISKSALPDREELSWSGKCLGGVFFSKLCLKRRDALPNILEN
jgi:hypothetical protein